MKTIYNLNEFLSLVDKNECPSGLRIDFGHMFLGVKYHGVVSTQHIATALQSGNCPSGLTIDLSVNNLDAESAKHIADALQSGNCPGGLTINFGGNILGTQGAEHIANALKSGNCPSGLTINHWNNAFGTKGTELIADALQSGNCPSRLTINLWNNNLGNVGARHIATALQSGKCPSGLTIDLGFNNLDTKGAEYIADALKSGNCPSGLTINLKRNNLSAEGAKHIAAALQSGNCPSDGLTIDLGSNNLGAEGAKHIAAALESEHCLEGLTINLWDNALGAEGAKHIAAALQSGKCPSGLTIDLGHNALRAEGAQHIATALQSGKCPEGLTINLNSNKLGTEGILSLAQMIMHNNMPADLCLDFNGWNNTHDTLTPEQTEILVKALLAAQHNIDRGLRLKGMPEVNLVFQKHLQNEAEYDDNSTANPQVCSPNAVQTRLTDLVNLYNSLDTLFPEEENLPETSLAILKSFGTLLTRYAPAYQPSTDVETVTAHYQYLDESLLPLITNWHKKLLKQSNITDTQRQQFIEGSECLANLYNTSFDNEILLTEDKTGSQRTGRQLAQRALAMRAKLYQLTYRYREESSAYLLTLLRLAESMTGKGLTFEGITGAQNKLENHTHALVAYKYMNDAWQAAAASNARLNSTLSENKQASSSSSNINIARVTPASATSATSAASPTGARSVTSATSSQANRAPREQGVFNQPNSRSKEGTTTAIEATAARADELTGPITSQSASAPSTPAAKKTIMAIAHR